MLASGSARQWTSFSAVLLVTVGTLNVAEGLLATLANDAGFNRQEVVAFTSTSTWGAATATLGLVLACTGLAVRLGKTAARRIAISVVALHALSQLALLRAYPAWSLLMIALDVLMLFVLTVPRSVRRPEPRGDGYRARHKAGQPELSPEWAVGPITPRVKAVGQAAVPATMALPLVPASPAVNAAVARAAVAKAAGVPAITGPPDEAPKAAGKAIVPVVVAEVEPEAVPEVTPSDLDVDDADAQPVGAVVRPYV
jgi:hypothetical protein